VAGFAASRDAEVKEWLAKWAGDPQRNLFDLTFRIAVSVFNGARYAAVYEAALALEEALTPPPAEGKPRPAPNPFDRKPRSQLLELAGAGTLWRSQADVYSDTAQVEVVELKDEAYAPAVLRCLWTEYDEFRDVLLEWLKAYAVDGRSRDIRLRAARAIGALGSVDFHTIQLEALRDWATVTVEDNNLRRLRFQALANALGVLIWDNERQGDVLGLLDALRSRGNESAMWATARAYTQIGLRYPLNAMREWRAIFNAQPRIELRLTDSLTLVLPHPVQRSVAEAVLSLFLHAVELPHSERLLFEPALEGLSEWAEADAQEPGGPQIGLPLFLAFTQIKVRPESAGVDEEEWPPAMLQIVGAQPDVKYRRILATLLRRAFRDGRLQAQAAEALRGWVEAAEKSPFLAKTLALVLREWLALPDATERERGMLTMYLTRWQNLPRSPLRVAGKLLIALNPAGPALAAPAPVKRGA
jgi:hypothetical protein